MELSTPARSPMILVAEDDDDDRELLLAAFRDADVASRLEFVADGQELMDYLRQDSRFRDPQRPSIVLLDLNMPRKSGREALSEIKSDDQLRDIPILVLSTSGEQRDVELSYRSGANSFISKPVTHVGLVEVARLVREYWLELVTLP